jgi:hypothetical protein
MFDAAVTVMQQSHILKNASNLITYCMKGLEESDIFLMFSKLLSLSSHDANSSKL